MEKKRPDALEMAEKTNAEKKKGDEAQDTINAWEYGVTRYPNGLQLGNDIIWVF